GGADTFVSTTRRSAGTLSRTSCRVAPSWPRRSSGHLRSAAPRPSRSTAFLPPPRSSLRRQMRIEVALIGVAAAWCAPAAAPVCGPVAAAFRIPVRLPQRHGIAVTFDDGPHRQGTPAVLEALARADVQATFFLVGEQVERRPGLAREIAAAGHEIG